MVLSDDSVCSLCFIFKMPIKVPSDYYSVMRLKKILTIVALYDEVDITEIRRSE